MSCCSCCCCQWRWRWRWWFHHHCCFHFSVKYVSTAQVTNASFVFSPSSLAITIAPVIFGISHHLICHISHSTVHVIDNIHLHSNFVICKRLGIGQTFSFCTAVCLSSSFNMGINRLGLGSDWVTHMYMYWARTELSYMNSFNNRLTDMTRHCFRCWVDTNLGI